MVRPIRSVRVRVSQGTFFWREIGHGPTLLMLHGSWSSSDQWVPLMEALGRQFHCVAPDLLGFGESSTLPLKTYSIETEVNALTECLKQLRTSPQFIVADSLGAWVAIRYCLKHPHQVKQLVIATPEGLTHPQLKQYWQPYRWLARAWAPRYWIIQTFAPLIIRFGQQKTWLRQIKARRQQLRQNTAACRLLFQRQRTVLQAEGLNEALPQLSTPMLILQPAIASHRTTLINALVHQLAPEAYIQIVPGTETGLWHQAVDDIQTWLKQSSI
ncbi:alpha/beta hydrolase [Oscillatoria sp. CS-180]|uniref:alpha/beta fold hydrolase n=1 Tax=Oscillatoria sp. CS-180 TaxID=3021720 RepID=UPI0023305ED5|nr:alpha/beta hydrolase [Oscillatoria sp. CS-180]MDB9527990.1 alpha/beta hydrolase [Oscillatoria sp. CS-180]